MNKDNIIIFAVAALAVFGVYKLTRTASGSQPATSGAINNTAVGGTFTPWYLGSNMPSDQWGLGFKLDPLDPDLLYTGDFQLTDLTKAFRA